MKLHSAGIEIIKEERMKKTMNKIEGNKFDIKSLQNIIDQSEMSLERLKTKSKTKKRIRHIKELESFIESKKDKIRILEIEIEIEEMKGEK